MSFDKLIGPLALFIAFVLTLGVYCVLRLDGIEGGPVDELLLILGGAVAGATSPQIRG